MMQKYAKCLVLAGVMLMASSIAKADYTSLTVKEKIGTWISYSLNGLRLTFTDNKMTLTNNEQTVEYPVVDLYSMEFTDLPSAIQKADKTYTMVSLEGGTIRINAEVGTEAKVYDTLGRLYTTARIGREGVPVCIGNLEPGIYIIKAGQEKCKVLVK